MDNFIPSLIAFLLLYFSLLKLVKSYVKPTNERLPPGPWKLPIIGSKHHLVSSLPHHALRDLATKYGPIMHLQLGELSTIVVSSPRAAKEVLRTHDLVLANRPQATSTNILSYNCVDITFSPFGDYWRKIRRICVSELLGPKCIQTLSTTREDEALSLVNSIKLSIGSPIDLSQKIISYTSNVISRAAFGKHHQKSSAEVMKLMNEVSTLLGGFQVADVFPSWKFLQFVSGLKSKSMKIHGELDNLFDTIISEQRKNMEIIENGRLGCKEENESLLDVLLRLEQSGGLDVPDPITSIKSIILDMFLAGTETTFSTVVWAMGEMIKHPKVMERVQAELRNTLQESHTGSNYLKMVIKETLRLHPPLSLLLPRENGTNITLDGYNIPPKTKFIVNAWAINRDSAYWSDSEKFIPERFNSSGDDFIGKDFEYIPFGGGRRVCPGMGFAVVSVEACLEQLLYHFDWELPDGKEAGCLDMSEAFGASVRMKNNLVLVPTLPKSS